jgi:hypothetical protein
LRSEFFGGKIRDSGKFGAMRKPFFLRKDRGLPDGACQKESQNAPERNFLVRNRLHKFFLPPVLKV